ncbi:FKBP-type peptidyl-prolyl cis-trans isomerase [Aquirhabdus sp.]|uniref:FKBP-type peptidyl-prolyl cis-trans isomerase n=1 Tax=Aquirhabdus sp. TaxID=2824160 RepID=UPI00396CDF8B
MQKKIVALTTLTTALFLTACNDKKPATLDTDNAKFSYAVGTQLGEKMTTTKTHIDLNALNAGIDDAFNGKPQKLDEAAKQAIFTKVMQQISQEQVADQQKKSEKNKTDGTAFLADNAKKPGVKVTASGLQYLVEKEGTGAHPTANDEVTINYRGSLIDGTEFDSSYARHEPATFPVGSVIPGFSEGLKLMTPGAKYKFFIPSSIAYGEAGAGPKVGPDSTLIFEVELISAKPAGAQALPPH